MPHAQKSQQQSSRSELKKVQIVSAATVLFLQRGFLDVSMDEIAQTARVSKRTLYNYFKSKEELFLALGKNQINLMASAMTFESEVSASLEAQLKHIGQQFLQAAYDPVTIQLYRLMVGEADRFPALAKSIYNDAFTDVVDKLGNVLKAHGEKGHLRIPNWRHASEHFIELALGLLHLRVVLGVEAPPKAQKLRSHMNEMVSFFLAAYRV